MPTLRTPLSNDEIKTIPHSLGPVELARTVLEAEANKEILLIVNDAYVAIDQRYKEDPKKRDAMKRLVPEFAQHEAQFYIAYLFNKAPTEPSLENAMKSDLAKLDGSYANNIYYRVHTAIDNALTKVINAGKEVSPRSHSDRFNRGDRGSRFDGDWGPNSN